MIGIGGAASTPGGGNINLKPDGSASFVGNLQVNGAGSQGSFQSVPTSGNGGYKAFRAKSATAGVSTQYYLYGEDVDGNGKVTIATDGSATFAGSDFYVNPAGSTRVGGTDFTDADIILNSGTGTITAIGNLELGRPNKVTLSGADGTAVFAGNVTAPNVTFNLEADNPANYTTTTDSEGNETQVYNGPVLDVKEVIQTLQQKVEERDATIATLTSRLSAVENADISDDAEHSALLTLVASLSTRVTALEQGGN